ncbi:MAG: diguanylate cyclase [Rhizobiales bacterium]|nr:diguanylate cyclase [Hyphomicrobiales bacterium]
MTDVFISYKSERRRAAEHLANILEIYGYDVWYDYRLVKGNNFNKEIDQKLRAAKVVIVLWCEMSVESDWVDREASLAVELNKFLPVKIENCSIKVAYHNKEYLDLTDWDGNPRTHALDSLFDEIERFTDKSPEPNYKELKNYGQLWLQFLKPSLKDLALSEAVTLTDLQKTDRTIPYNTENYPSNDPVNLNDFLFDQLTGLPKRALFTDRLYVATNRAKFENEAVSPVVFSIEIDNFEKLNLNLDKDIIDNIILIITRRFIRLLGSQDTLARFCDGKIAVLLIKENRPQEIALLAESLRRSVSVPMNIAGQEMKLTVSIGVSVYDRGHKTPNQLIKQSEIAMTIAAKLGNRIEAFRPSMLD